MRAQRKRATEEPFAKGRARQRPPAFRRGRDFRALKKSGCIHMDDRLQTARSCHCGHCKAALPSGRFRLHNSHLPRRGTHMRIVATSTPAHRTGPSPTAVGDAGCRQGPIRPPGPASTGLRVRSAHRPVTPRGSDLARRGALVPWVTKTASVAAPATHSTPCVVTLARFSGFISMQFPRETADIVL